MGNLRVYCLKTLNKLSIYPLDNTPSAPSVHAISRVACCKLAHHQLDLYQHAMFCHSIIQQNLGEEEADPTLELAMEYSGALGTIIFDKSCHLRDLTKAQIGRNQFAVDVAVD